MLFKLGILVTLEHLLKNLSYIFLCSIEQSSAKLFYVLRCVYDIVMFPGYFYSSIFWIIVMVNPNILSVIHSILL